MRPHHERPAPSRAGFFFSAPRTANLFAVLALAASMPALAQVNATGDYLSRMDGDRDGRVSLAEYQDWMSYAFTRMDTDGDGILSSAELPGGRGQPISLVEHREKLAATFGRQDRNRDGYLNATELAAPPQ